MAQNVKHAARNLDRHRKFVKIEPLWGYLFHSNASKRIARLPIRECVAGGWPWAGELVAAFSRLPRFST